MVTVHAWKEADSVATLQRILTPITLIKPRSGKQQWKRAFAFGQPKCHLERDAVRRGQCDANSPPGGPVIVHFFAGNLGPGNRRYLSGKTADEIFDEQRSDFLPSLFPIIERLNLATIEKFKQRRQLSA